MQTPKLPPFAHQAQPYTGPSPDEILRLRKEFLNPGIFLYYKKPLTLVEGKMQYVWDADGREYLDRTPFRRGTETLIRKLREADHRRRRLSEDE